MTTPHTRWLAKTFSAPRLASALDELENRAIDVTRRLFPATRGRVPRFGCSAPFIVQRRERTTLRRSTRPGTATGVLRAGQRAPARILACRPVWHRPKAPCYFRSSLRCDQPVITPLHLEATPHSPTLGFSVDGGSGGRDSNSQPGYVDLSGWCCPVQLEQAFFIWDSRFIGSYDPQLWRVCDQVVTS